MHDRERNTGGEPSESMRDPLDNETGIRVDDLYPGALEFDQDASLYADDAGFIFGVRRRI